MLDRGILQPGHNRDIPRVDDAEALTRQEGPADVTHEHRGTTCPGSLDEPEDAPGQWLRVLDVTCQYQLGALTVAVQHVADDGRRYHAVRLRVEPDRCDGDGVDLAGQYGGRAC